MLIEVRVFGGLTERVGGPRTTLELDDDATVADLRAAVAAEHPAIAPLLPAVTVAVDLEVADDTTALRGAREVALLPPVAGGAPDGEVPRGTPDAGAVRIVTGLQQPPLPVTATIEAVTGPQVGATAVFLGTVRDHAAGAPAVVGLDYTAYDAMARRVLAELADDLATDHPDLRGIALIHAVGELEVGEHTVLIVCTSGHRHAAFAACEDALERVKDRLPVFKRERLPDGDHRWVGLPEPGDATPGPGGGS